MRQAHWKNGQYLAGLEFLLEPGWHTYWRYPGDAGIPPQISFEGAENLADAEVLYPAPERYDDGFSESIVYHDGIVLPIRVTPEHAERRVRLSVDVFFGICKEICVPGDAALSLDLDPAAETDGLASRLIERDLAAVPEAGADGDLRISSVTLSDQRDSLVIEAQVRDGQSPDLFAAAPEGSYIGLPKFTGQSAGRATWRLSTKGLAASAGDNMLRLVLTAGDKAVEHLQPIGPDWVK
ncbi:protein-disulfide reductase DsbD family protein [Roseibium salinum]|nr:protein-disulfide reductase DsbD family protein [Roseibium salinum]